MTVIGHGYDDNVGAPAFRNVIINGGMSVAQRSSSVASITGSAYNTADRWTTYINTLGTWTNSVENDAPTGSGLTKSSKMLCTTANASPAAGAYAQLTQPIEGQNLQHFAKGTASAKQFALSFWVKSNVTGTYIVELTAGSRAVSASYTVSVSATWEKKTIIFPADAVTSIVNDNTAGLYCAFMLGAGSNYTSGTLQTTWAAIVSANRYVGQTNLAAATSNYWQITGVQLEAGPVATPFEFLPFGEELRRCQRYYQIIPSGRINGICASATGINRFGGPLIPEMRTAPPTCGIVGIIPVFDGVNIGTVTAVSGLYNASTYVEFDVVLATGSFAEYRPVHSYVSPGSGYLTASAEL